VNERLQKQLDFLLEIDKEKQIFRQTHILGYGRRENDAEHAWHMAVMAFVLAEYVDDPVDVLRVVQMVLIHDLVEIYAGDTYAYDEEAKATQKDRELAAADRIFGMLPEDQGRQMREVWEEFEAYETAEARFAHLLDNYQPLFLSDANGGQDWVSHGVTRSQILKRNERALDVSEAMGRVIRQVIDKNVEKGTIRDE
jgi:putative hydrolase of HD superfamily